MSGREFSELEQKRRDAAVSRTRLAEEIGGELGTPAKVYRIERSVVGGRTSDAERRLYEAALNRLIRTDGDNPPVDPDVGRPVSLGEDFDRADAEAMLAIIRAGVGVRERHGPSAAMHMARESLWDVWERPRLPRPLLTSKYPMSYPWSPAARDLWEENEGRRPPGGWGLILEHMTPRRLLLLELFENASQLTPETLRDLLFAKLAGAVVTKEDDRILSGAGFGASLPVGTLSGDNWARYRAAGFDPMAFEPLPIDPIDG
ncbi:hypothetical protein IEU95_16010 [Hoyosella rhizosphaerae]|uniref:Uncharacterized protein n=1 Tax=Hoyosella rhizosphaerae TaxID=1755582 RepID=A0A916UJL3_9ACTN|nr:hypothetical protein [Hoyosella rhizosphaerae]MBN4928340.1 hypothetical protein [Hoyosella rhizosphaerae]GGC74188.1 hypothetical protein GCM10011410_29300 [Hoyosella rhizosphaerae]